MVIRVFGFWLLLLSATFAQTPQSLGTASISGRLTFKEQPLPGVLVTLERAGANPNSQQAPISAKTDTDGRYRLTGIAAGQYSVSPHALAYVVPFDGATYRPGKTVTISDGEALEGFDFALVKGGVIAGMITDHTGRAVIGQRVNLERLNEQGKASAFRSGNYRMFETDDRGAYRLYGLPAGRYKISLGEGGKDGSITVGRVGGFYRLTYYPGVTDEAEARIVELTEGGESTDIDFKVSKPEKTYEAKGRVIDGSTSAPLSGLNVAHGALPKGQENIGGYGSTNEMTNANGEFVIRGLTPGRYAAFPVTNSFFLGADASKEYFSDPTIFEVISNDVEGLEIKAQRGASLSGSVVIEGANDPAILKLLTRVTVSARIETKATQSPSRSAQVNPDGTFRLSGLRPGKARLTTFVSDGSPLMLVRVEREGVPLRDGIELTGTEPISGVKLTLVYGSGAIRGEVKVIGTLSPDTRLFVWANHGGQDAGRSTPVDARGRFVLENLAPGEYALSISQSVVSGTSTTHTRPVPMQKVTVGAGETTVTLTLDLNGKGPQ